MDITHEQIVFENYLKKLFSTANRGNAESQYTLGMYYYTGYCSSFNKDLAKAKKWLKNAANQGNCEAISVLKEIKLLHSKTS